MPACIAEVVSDSERSSPGLKDLPLTGHWVAPAARNRAAVPLGGLGAP